MGPLALIVKRARGGLGLLVTILALTATSVAIIAGTLGYSQAAATTAAQQALTGAVPTEAGIRVQTRLAEDPAAQDDAARRIIDAAFAPAPVEVQRTLVSEPRPVQDRDARLVAWASTALLADDPDFAARVEVLQGSWPPGPREGGEGQGGTVAGALHAEAAERLEVTVGDIREVGDATVTVAALWRPVDPEAAFWFGDPLASAGVDDGATGPLVVHAEAITSLGGTPFSRWTVQPDAEQIEPDDLPLLASAASRLDSAMRTPRVDVRGVTVEGDLAPTAATAARNLATARALNVIPVVLLLLVSVIAVVQIARLLAHTRSGQVELFLARGASRCQVLAWTAVEAVVLAVIATGLGVAVALALMRWVPAGDQQTGVVARAGVLIGLAALVVISAWQVRTLADRHTIDRSGRTRAVAALGTLVLTLGAALLSWWQLRRYGSPLVVADDGSLQTDLLAGAAPALLLAATAVIALALLGPLSRLAEALTRPARRAAGHLAASQVSRRLVVFAVPVVLTVLALGSATVAGLYAATSTGLRDDLAAVAQGAEVRAGLSTPPAGGSTVASIPDVTGLSAVTGSAPVWQTTARVGPTPVGVTILPTDRLDTVTSVPERAVDPERTEGALAVGAAEPSGAVLPAEAATLTIPVEVTIEPREGLDRTLGQSLLEREESLRSELGAEGLSEQEILTEIRSDRQSVVGRFQPASMEMTAWVWDPGRLGRQEVDLGTVDTGISVTIDGGGPDDPPANQEFVLSRELDIEVTGVPDTAEFTLELPPGAEGRHLVGLTLELPQYAEDPWQTDASYQGIADYQVTVDITGMVTEDGTNLLTTDSFDGWWMSIPPPTDPWLPSPTTSGVIVPGENGGLRLIGSSGGDVVADPESVQQVTLAAPPSDAADLPIAVTSGLAQVNNLSVGSAVDLSLFGSLVSAEVAQVLPVVPGRLDTHGILIDAETLGNWALQEQSRIPPPDQIWVASADPPATMTALGNLDGIASVSGADAVSVTDAASAVRQIFWVASAGAVLLAITGIAAVASNLLRTRRSDVAVLRALGVTPITQAGTRIAELLGVVLAAAVLGVGGGFLVGGLVIPELAASTTLEGQVPLDPLLRVEWPVWLAQVGLLTGAMAVVLLVVGWRVRSQALDREYREEIR